MIFKLIPRRDKRTGLRVTVPESFQDYRVYRNKLNSIIRHEKRKFYNGKFLKYKSDMRKTWQMINRRVRPHNRKSTSVECLEINGEKITQPKDILNTLGDYFSNIAFRLA